MPDSLNVILNLVGKLDDTPGENTARERFRDYLGREIENVGHARDLIEECLRESDTQYARALQDLVNYVGHFLGFEVEHGRYQGTTSDIGHDGLWSSPEGFYVVVETKTTEQFTIKTSTLTGYVDRLISERRIPDKESAMGLYVIGEPDEEVSHLENSIIAEKKTNQLRTISVDALLSLAELLSEYDVTHEDALAVLRPSGPSIDPIANLMARIVAQEQVRQQDQEALQEASSTQSGTNTVAEPKPSPGTDGEPSYWLTPVSDKGEMTSKEVIDHLVGRDQIYGYGKSTPGRKDLASGDKIAFYASGEGVVGHAEFASRPEKRDVPSNHLTIPDAEEYPYIFRLRNPVLHLDEPIVIDQEVRANLDAFDDSDPEAAWGWFVVSTSRLTQHDFEALTRQEDTSTTSTS
jgi:hypothetical protein